MQHGTHTGAGVISLKVTRAVPHECADPIADLDSRIIQCVCQLVSPIASLPIGLSTHTVRCGGDNFLIRGDFRSPVENSGHQ